MKQYQIDSLHKLAASGDKPETNPHPILSFMLNGAQNIANDTADTITKGVFHPTQIPSIVNESYIKPMKESVSMVPGATKDLFSKDKTFRERSTALSKATIGTLWPAALLTPIGRGVLGKVSPAVAINSIGGVLGLESFVGNALSGVSKRMVEKTEKENRFNSAPFVIKANQQNQQNQELKDQELLHAFGAGTMPSLQSDEEKEWWKQRRLETEKENQFNNTPFAREVNQQNQDIKDQELLHAFGAGTMILPSSDEKKEWIDQRREEAAKAPVVSNKPSILKILKDHKGWIAGAAAGGLVLGIAKNYMDKRKEAEDKKKQQRRLFLQSQYPILHP